MRQGYSRSNLRREDGASHAALDERVSVDLTKDMWLDAECTVNKQIYETH